MHEFTINSQFKLGYRNREDVTNTAPGVLITGSQNVLTNVSDRVQIRQGYSCDGTASSVAAPVLESFDWLTKTNGEVHLRAGSLTSAGNDGRLQYRYVDASGNVTWRDLITGLTTVAYNFTTFWDTTELLRVCLFVNGTSNIFKWNGAVATLSSADNTAGHIQVLAAAPSAGGTGYTVGDVLTITTGGTGGTATVLTLGGSGAVATVALTTTGVGYTTGGSKATTGGTGTSCTLSITTVATGSIVVSGSTSITDLGFYLTTNLNLVINGTTYAYVAVVGNTFVGISPSAAAEAAGSVIINAVVTTANSSMTAITSTFKNGLIKVMNNQIFLGSLSSSVVWLSKVNSYTDYSSSSTRQTGEGGSLVLDQSMVAFNVQGDQSNATMYGSAGTDIWYKFTFTPFTSVVGASGETFGAVPIKTGRRQGAISQAFVSSMKNNTITVTNETTIDMIGVMENYLTQIQTKNISDSIKLDIDSYDFTNGSIAYWRYYILVAVPVEGLVLIYNLATGSWEAPQTIPVSRFYIVNGDLYAHSYGSFESYQLFTGYADRVYTQLDGSPSVFTGFPIQANWVFSYENFGSRFSYKKCTKMYVEGYINSNTTLTANLTYELDGCALTRSFELDGSNSQFVCVTGAEGSLGKESLGKIKLGGSQVSSINGLPPKFRWFPTFDPHDFFESSISFSVLGTDERAEILAFGLAVSGSSEIAVQNYD